MKQLFAGRKEPTREKLRLIKNQTGFCKPGDGGLWTSTLVRGNSSSWVEWCINEEFSNPRRGWILTPCENARVYTINSLPDLEHLYNHFPLVNDYASKYGIKYLDFELIATTLDAIHLTEEGQVETRLSHPLSLYGWDCESTLWFRWVFEEVKGPIRIGEEANACTS